jgi:diaminopimelate decarboxylase
VLDLGGGLGISYLPQDNPPPMKELADKLKVIVEHEAAAVGLPTPTLVVEPGRAIAGPGTITLYEVGTVKDVAVSATAQRRYISVDGGMSDNIRPRCMTPLRRPAGVAASDAPAVLAASSESIARAVTSSSGHLGSEDLAPGDLLAVAATGAYATRCRVDTTCCGPAVVAVKDGTARLSCAGKPSRIF